MLLGDQAGEQLWLSILHGVLFSFFLLRYQSGAIDDIASGMRIEVKRAAWIPLDEAARKLAYRGEREMVKRAQEYLKSHPEVWHAA